MFSARGELDPGGSSNPVISSVWIVLPVSAGSDPSARHSLVRTGGTFLVGISNSFYSGVGFGMKMSPKMFLVKYTLDVTVLHLQPQHNELARSWCLELFFYSRGQIIQYIKSGFIMVRPRRRSFCLLEVSRTDPHRADLTGHLGSTAHSSWLNLRLGQSVRLCVIFVLRSHLEHCTKLWIFKTVSSEREHCDPDRDRNVFLCFKEGKKKSMPCNVTTSTKELCLKTRGLERSQGLRQIAVSTQISTN